MQWKCLRALNNRGVGKCMCRRSGLRSARKNAAGGHPEHPRRIGLGNGQALQFCRASIGSKAVRQVGQLGRHHGALALIEMPAMQV
jgi:hypothetical protein